MSQQTFTSKADFLANGIEAVPAKEVEGADCPICQEKLSAATEPASDTAAATAAAIETLCRNPVKVKSCRHIFGKDCLETWLKGEKSTCPMCRTELFSTNKEGTWGNPIDRLYEAAGIVVHDDLGSDSDSDDAGSVEYDFEGVEYDVEESDYRFFYDLIQPFGAYRPFGEDPPAEGPP
jgi:hypothetical protein